MAGAVPPEMNDVFADLAACLLAMGPYREDAVLTGGLVPLLYRFAIPGVVNPHPPITTFDIDWTLPAPLQLREQSLHRLFLNNGFVQLLRTSVGAHHPVTYYQHERHGDSELARIHVELLAPRQGGRTDRSGRNRTVEPIQDEVIAQRLPYLDLLLFCPFQFDVASIDGLSLDGACFINLPNPTCFVLQKARPH